MKKKIEITFFVFALVILSCLTLNTKNLYSQQEDPNNPRTWNYFKILARSEDDSIFIIFQDDVGIDPKLESYTIVVNITDPNAQNQFVVVGDELDPSSQRFAWSQLSKRVQDGLKNWSGTNKENLNQKKL